MRHSLVHIIGAAAIGATLALFAAPASAKTIKECNAEYAAQKAELKAAGTKKADFVASCRAEPDAAAPGAAAAPTAPTASPAATAAPPSVKTAKECNAEYSDNKAAIRAGGQTKKDFVAACRAGTETIPTAAATAPAATPPADPMAPKPPMSPAEAAPAPMAPASTAARPAAKTGAAIEGGFATDAVAKAHCPSDAVVWMNTKSKIYHYAGTHAYGDTKQGTYMCESDAKNVGRAAKNEKHP